MAVYDKERLLSEKKDAEERWARQIAGNLRQLRLRDGLTISALAARTGIGWRTIENWEKENCTPSVPKAMWLCKAMGWKMSEIIGGIRNGQRQDI